MTLVNGFHSRIDGRSNGPWVVLSNSIGANLSIWDDLVPTLTDRYRVFRYDQRGHGHSLVTPPPYSFEQLADDLLGLMDSVGIERAHYVGLSMGGVTGWQLTRAHQNRLLSLTICDAAITASTAAWEERLNLMRTSGQAALAEATLERWFAKRALAENADSVQRSRAMLLSTPQAGFTGCANALQNFDFTADLPSIRTRTLLISGAEDGTRPQAIVNEAARIPGAKYAVIPDAGHLSNLENPGVFNRTVIDFIDSVAEGR